MNLDINNEQPNIMHIDLNSAFATTEQQAHPSLRGRPLGVTNRLSYNCCLVAVSYEAKALGIKGGWRLQDALKVAPDLVVLETDPPKYHHVYKTLARIMKSYSPNVVMKSIDEGVLDFHGTREFVNKRPLEEIGYEIKQRVKDELGDWMRINVGIAPNRFLAKTAAGLHKPDGLDVIDHTNLRSVFDSLQLTDLTGIARHFKTRLNMAGIYTPLEFLDAEADYLRRFVFHGVIGEDWYKRLRGWEVDHNPTNLGTIGRQHVISEHSADDKVLLPRFQYLCESVGKKVRFQDVDARGVLVWLRFKSGDGWYQRKMYTVPFYTDKEIYRRALEVFNQRPKHMIVTTMGITCYQLTPTRRSQISLLEYENKQEDLTQAVDEVNERFDSFMLTSANSAAGKHLVKQKIPFGGTKYFELLLKRA